MGRDFPSYTPDVMIMFDRNPAGQISYMTRSNNAYAWTGAYNVNRPYTTNGLNQYSAAGAASFTYDANGNLTADGTHTFTYDIENRLVGRSGGVVLAYDPLGRLYEVTGGSGTTRFLYDGDALVAEYDSAGAMTRRYVHNAGADVPLLSYAGAGLGQLSYLHADHQGSIVAVSNAAGASTANTYDEYGIPGAANSGRFQYTGQIWLAELGMYHYKARVYSPTLGRFLQTDPIGYQDQFNLYAYVGNDPINLNDPSGRQAIPIPIHRGWPVPIFFPPPLRLPAPVTYPPSMSLPGVAIEGGLRAVQEMLQNQARPPRPSDGLPIREGAELVRPGRPGVDEIYRKPGEQEEADREFNGNVDHQQGIRLIGPQGEGGRTGVTPNGNHITVRPSGTHDPRPTVSITEPRRSGNRNIDKFRYGED